MNKFSVACKTKKPAELKAELERLLPALEKIIDVLHNHDLNVPSLVASDKDEEARFMANQLYNLEEGLKRIVWDVEYLNGEPGKAGKLKKNSDGRYALANGDYWSCGSGIELKLWDDDEERWEWVKTRIEYSHEKDDYYAVNAPKLNLKGVIARRRREAINWSRDW